MRCRQRGSLKSKIENRKLTWRRGYESNIPRPVERADNGFEDREGHQAPITLRAQRNPNIQRPTSNAQHPTPNIQRPTSNCPEAISKAEHPVSLDVGCWMLDVGCFPLRPPVESESARGAPPAITASS